MLGEVISSSATTRPGDGRATRWAGQRERRRREFVDAALRAIAENGPQVSTTHIADEAGIARPQLYKHFDDATDLQRAIADEAALLVTTALRPLWELRGSAMQLITVAVDAHTGWLAENGNLYRYLSLHSYGDRDAVADVRTVIARQLTQLFEHYMTMFEMDTRVAESIAFGVVGLVDSCAAQWLENPNGVPRAELADLLTRWIWRVLDDTLRAGGDELDPHLPLPPPPPPPAFQPA
ncbi:TetR family transcriptional regulator [Amycolatopsis sp. WAC 01376]|uniref:TetR/AcrR family transcriptional regulator n=1 Tax=Amycolatopsis sp. WAC 01376 TaxID=2203195 RepID=UPI000F77327C|nr:TetR/AcrR family transcriptional regulator [Amycolatopsis sp. WAC 01376]RSM52202.1 TetR family transcriptional regulator [Amycolatopsis sp. WAC 01376]